MKPPINSSKHYVQISLTSTASGAVGVNTIAEGVAVVDLNSASEVREGAVIKAVYIEYWVRGSDAGVGSSFVVILEKSSGGSPAPAAGNLAALNNYLNKKNVLYASQGLANDDTGVATPVLRQWVKIPKSKQRFGLGDQLQLFIFAQTGSFEHCGVIVYKEYF